MTPNERHIVIWSNFGRWLGWEVYLEEQRVCTLCYHSESDQFWDSYVVFDSDSQFNVESDEFWDNSQFKAQSHIGSDIVVDELIFRWNGATKLLLVRGLYVKNLRISFWDRIRIVLGDL